jgi:hypothetical protein
MGGIGGLSPFPLPIGGGPSGAEIVYRILRAAVGGDSGAGPVGGIEDHWRWCKAEAIWAGLESAERAALQSLPRYATDHLEVYEDLLHVPRADTDAERAIAVTAAFVLQLSADVPNLSAELRSIDEAFSIQSVQYAQATIVHFGKAFGARPGASGPAYGSGLSSGVNATAWPNYATDFVLHVKYTLSVGQLNPSAEILARARRLLCSVLPSWVDFRITSVGAGGAGFFLDGGSDGTSLLDLTAFG